MKGLLIFIGCMLLAFGAYVSHAGVEVVKPGEAVKFQDENGAPFGVKHIGNMMEVVSTSHGHQVALGNVTGHQTLNVIGYGPDTAAILTDISELGVTVIPIPLSAARVEISSTDADDIASGNGTKGVHIVGLDSNYDPISESLPTRGLGIITSVNSYIRFNSFHSYSVGSTGVAEGIISVKNIGGATEYIRIGAGGNQSLNSLFTIPNGKIGTVKSWSPGFATVSNNTIGRALFRATVDHTRLTVQPGVFLFQGVAVGQNSSVNIPISPPLAFPAKTDIKVSTQKVAGSATMAVSSGFNIMLEDTP